MRTAELAGDDPAVRALWLPIERGDLAWPASGRVLFMGARVNPSLLACDTRGLVCQQDFRPFADVLERHELNVTDLEADARFDLVVLLPPRQREARRATLARALSHVAGGGALLVSVANNAGARSAQDDLESLVGPVQCLSKHKCRVFWIRPDTAQLAGDIQRDWLGWDALRPTVEGMVSRPGLFAWDRVDPASALLAEHLPAELTGVVADLGAGAGYLSMQLVRRCPNVTGIDLYEADARALPAARINLEHACAVHGREVTYTLHWHDVAAGLPDSYDHIVSNPPFHQGRADLPQLGRAFIVAAAKALRPGGTFWMVANRHLAYEATLRAEFARVRTVVEGDGYKVIEAAR